jgi:hypothetical protein
MERQRLRQRLEELHRELEQTESVEDESARRLLEELMDDIREILGRSEEAEESHAPFLERLQEATLRFEESHPRLARTAARVVDALSSLGI